MGCTVGTKTSSQTLQGQDTEPVGRNEIGNTHADNNTNVDNKVVTSSTNTVTSGGTTQCDSKQKYTGYSLFMEKNLEAAQKQKNNERFPEVRKHVENPIHGSAEVITPTKRKAVDGKAVEDSMTPETSHEIPQSLETSPSESSVRL